MPNDIKAGVCVVTMLVACAIAYWEHSTGRTDLAWFVIGTAIFMVVSMWVFPEAVGKKRKKDR